MDGEDRCVEQKKESEPACWPTFNGWAGVIFLPLPVPLPVSGFPVKSSPRHVSRRVPVLRVRFFADRSKINLTKLIIRLHSARARHAEY